MGYSKSVCLKTLIMPEAILGVMGGPMRQQATESLKNDFGYTDDQITTAQGDPASVTKRTDALVAKVFQTDNWSINEQRKLRSNDIRQVGNEPTTLLNNPAPQMPGIRRFRWWRKKGMPIQALPQLR